ncbi:hypothetical protein SKAU_G00138320 [Synaphobranchus kaupii]|uniref:Myb/SANT-like DNA-binding domain-containing protein n=1 Tax=Synaphobranchus kaupii TaxID=118154 RepID=A0A9Q1J3R2_SYNKA|nr:hypothetical protein SKAU_G00138320 [Synaphobranchus kaupii]
MDVKRKPNWTVEETVMLEEEVEAKKEIIKGKFSPTLTSSHKKEVWKQIADSINASFSSTIWSPDECEKKCGVGDCQDAALLKLQIVVSNADENTISSPHELPVEELPAATALLPGPSGIPSPAAGPEPLLPETPLATATPQLNPDEVEDMDALRREELRMSIKVLRMEEHYEILPIAVFF